MTHFQKLFAFTCKYNFSFSSQNFTSSALPLLTQFRLRSRYLSMENEPGPVQVVIEKKLKDKFEPLYLEIVNESYKHSVPKGSESHFKVVVVSEVFEGKALIQRHRAVNEILANELKNYIHALSIQAKTPAQWESSGHQVANTPPCLGGSKADRK